MSKASDRRKNRRASFLGELAEKDPGRFSMEWSIRLDSLMRRIEVAGARRGGRPGPDLPDVFALVEQGMKELARCGSTAVALEGAETRRVLTETACRAVARIADPRIFRMNNHRHLQESGARSSRREEERW